MCQINGQELQSTPEWGFFSVTNAISI